MLSEKDKKGIMLMAGVGVPRAFCVVTTTSSFTPRPFAARLDVRMSATLCSSKSNLVHKVKSARRTSSRSGEREPRTSPYAESHRRSGAWLRCSRSRCFWSCGWLDVHVLLHGGHRRAPRSCTITSRWPGWGNLRVDQWGSSGVVRGIEAIESIKSRPLL